MRPLTISTALLVAGAAIGLLTAIHQMDVAGYSAAENSPGWQSWQQGKQSFWQFYGIQRFLNDGALPPPKAAELYTRSLDDDGNQLHSDCTYNLSGPALQARWWSLASLSDTAIDAADVLVAGAAQISQDHVLDVNISRLPQGGNWLKVPASGSYIVRFVVNDPVDVVHLPGIKKMGC